MATLCGLWLFVMVMWWQGSCGLSGQVADEEYNGTRHQELITSVRQKVHAQGQPTFARDRG